MANTTRNGILQVSDSSTGSGTPVSIVDPIGAEPSADSVSVTLATDQAPIHTIVDNASIPVTGPLTNTELRAVAVPVSVSSLPLPTGAATEATLSAVKAKTDNLDVLLSTRTKPSDQQHSIIDSSVLPTGAATAALQTQPGVDIGDVTVNNAAGAAAVNIQDGGNSITVDAVSLPLPTGASTEATLALIKAKTDNIDVALSTRTKPTDQQHVIVDSSVSIAVIGPLTDTQLRATPIPVSGTVTTTPPNNASTNLTQVNGAAVSLGTALDVASIPVTLSTENQQMLSLLTLILAELRAIHLQNAAINNTYIDALELVDSSSLH